MPVKSYYIIYICVFGAS